MPPPNVKKIDFTETPPKQDGPAFDITLMPPPEVVSKKRITTRLKFSIEDDGTIRIGPGNSLDVALDMDELDYFLEFVRATEAVRDQARARGITP